MQSSGWTPCAWGLGLVIAAACGGKPDPAGAGDDCYRDADCQPGLVCVAATEGGARTCSNDLTNLDSQVEGPPAAAPPEEMAPPDEMTPPDEMATDGGAG